jgi:hypothetical protein
LEAPLNKLQVLGLQVFWSIYYYMMHGYSIWVWVLVPGTYPYQYRVHIRTLTYAHTCTLVFLKCRITYRYPYRGPVPHLHLGNTYRNIISLRVYYNLRNTDTKH